MTLHESKAYETNVNKLRHELLDAAGHLTDKTLHQIFMEITLAHPFGSCITYKSIEPGMRKRRQSLFSNIPRKNIKYVDPLISHN